jgi:DNA-3-methyladenine glycosylase II
LQGDSDGALSAMIQQEAIAHLKRTDPVIARLIRRIGPCRLGRSGSYFLTLVEAIVWQQLSWKAALTIHGRMLEVVGSRRPTPAHFLRVTPAKLRGAGLSRNKAAYLLSLAEYFDSGRFPRRRIPRMYDDDIIEELTTIKGIGRWSAEMFLIFALNRPDVFPKGDLGLRKAIAGWYGMDGNPDDDQLETVSRPWRPHRTVATWYLWQSADGTPFKEGSS